MLTIQLSVVEAMNVVLQREIMKSSPTLTPLPRTEMDDQNTQRRVKDIVSDTAVPVLKESYEGIKDHFA